jgi:hypothetical protein
MEHDKNVVINDNDGAMSDDEIVVDVDPKEITPNPYVLAHNMRVAQFKQRFAEVEGIAHEL